MTDYGSSFASFTRAYRPWGQVRRQNLIARIVHVVFMTVLGLALLAGLALLVVFAASVALVGAVAVGLLAVMACLRRTPAKVFIRTRDAQKAPKSAKGVYEARKSGSTWIVY